MGSIEGGYKGFMFVIKNVAFNPTLFFPVNFKGKREDLDFCFISHFGPATKNKTNANTYSSDTMLST